MWKHNRHEYWVHHKRLIDGSSRQSNYWGRFIVDHLATVLLRVDMWGLGLGYATTWIPFPLLSWYLFKILLSEILKNLAGISKVEQDWPSLDLTGDEGDLEKMLFVSLVLTLYCVGKGELDEHILNVPGSEFRILFYLFFLKYFL